MNAACKRHDRAYGRVPGLRKYVTGLGSPRIRQADRRLVRAVQEARRTTCMSVSDRRKVRAIETLFRAKEGVNRGVETVRGRASATGRHASRLGRSAARRPAGGWSRSREATRARLTGLRLLNARGRARR